MAGEIVHAAGIVWNRCFEHGGNSLNFTRAQMESGLQRRRSRVALLLMMGVSLFASLWGVEVQAQTAPAAPQNVRIYYGTPTAPPVTISVSPASVTLAPGATVQFTATVSGTTNTAVSWTATGGTVTQTGTYTAGSTTGTYAVTATLTGGTISATAQVTIATGPSTIDINPGEDIQGKVNVATSGTVFKLKAGTHRLSAPVTLKDGMTIVGESGTIVSGARVLTGWVADGSDWKVIGQTQQIAPHPGAQCLDGYPRCRYPEDLFMDNTFLRHVDSRAALGPGKWFFDYQNDTIYMRDNPAGHIMETSVAPGAFTGNSSGVVIRSLVIEKFACNAQMAAIAGGNGSGWTVSDNDVRFNHGAAIDVGANAKVLNNKFHHNGQQGIHIGGAVKKGILLEGNEIAYNNQAGFNPGWEGGGSKFTLTDGLIVRNNWAHHNLGPGLWTDEDNINTTYEYNTAEDNFVPAGVTVSAAGIFHEISYSGVIRYNTVRRNGIGFDAWGWGAGIVVAASGGTGLEIYGNTVEDNKDGIMLIQQNRGSGLYGAHIVQNVDVHHNTVRMSEGWTGAVQDINDTAIFTSRNNRFHDNIYYLGALTRYFAWMNRDVTDSEWKGYGQDTSGTFNR